MLSRTDRLYDQLFNRLRFKSLQVFMSAYESRSIRATGALLDMSQSAATKKIQEVEAAVGEELFTRTVNGLEPTAAGAATYVACKRLAGVTREWASTLGSMRQGEGLRLSLGFSSGFFTAEMQGLLAGLSQAVPMLSLSVSVSSGHEISEALKRGSIDWAFGVTNNLASDYATLPAQPVHLAVVLNNNNLQMNEIAQVNRGELPTRTSLATVIQTKLRWVLPPNGDPIRTAFNNACPVGTFEARLEVSNLQEGLALLAGTDHVMLTTWEAAQANSIARQFTVLRLTPEVQLCETVVAYSHHHKLTSADGFLLRTLTELSENAWRLPVAKQDLAA